MQEDYVKISKTNHSFFEEIVLKLYTYFGFRNGKLVTVIQSTMDNVEDAIDCTRYVADPQEAEKQITEWKKGKE